MPDWLEQTLAALLMIAVLIDVFVTVLDARSRMGSFSFYTAWAAWRVFYGVASIFERHRGAMMSCCGSAILTANASSVACMLHDALGSIDLTAQRVDG